MIRLGIFTDEISQNFEEAVEVALENDLRNLAIRDVWDKNVGNLNKHDKYIYVFNEYIFWRFRIRIFKNGEE